MSPLSFLAVRMGGQRDGMKVVRQQLISGSIFSHGF